MKAFPYHLKEPSGERAPLMDLDQWQSWTLNMLKVFRQNRSVCSASEEESASSRVKSSRGPLFFASLETSVTAFGPLVKTTSFSK